MTAVKQAIPGVSPSSVAETTIMTVWPTAGAIVPGRLLGQLYNWAGRTGIGLGHILTLRNLVMIATMPLMALFSLWLLLVDALSLVLSLLASLLLIFPKFRPITFFYVYRLTNRRVIVERLLSRQEVSSLALDQFDQIDIVVLPGQEWYPAGELVFRRGEVETFRLSGVGTPEVFQRACLRAHQSYVGVKAALSHRG